jgi:hypothetical protein
MADRSSDELRRALRAAGLSRHAIDAAWPSWWNDEAASSASARAELRFALARNLGLSPKSLIGERVEFVWHRQGRFKNLSGQTAGEQAALNAFGTAIGRSLLQAVPAGPSLGGMAVNDIRRAVLASNRVVDLNGLLATCWAVGMPVIHLRVFPLQAKAMHAMVVESGDRHAILLGRDASYPAPVAFTLAHEIAHVVLGHLDGASALIDVEDPATSGSNDREEQDADRFALALLTGSAEPRIETNRAVFGGRQLAAAVLDAGPPLGIDPGTLALCVGFQQDRWPAAMASLRHIYAASKPVWSEVNHIAEATLDWDALDYDGGDYLRTVMGLAVA